MKESRTGVSQAFTLLGAFLALSMVIGLLGAGIFVPVVGLAGLGVKQAAGTFEALPAEFTASPMAQQTHILAADGSTIATLYEENRVVVPFAKIAPVMRDAQIAIEDNRFYEHGGVDPRGILRAFVQTAQGDKQGASTITQQYVKQTRIYQCMRDDNKQCAEEAQARGGVAGVVRKLQEAKYAVELEKKMSKDQILEGYLNLVYYGSGAYGVEAAARRYFGISADKLSLPQAALIAGMAQRPGVTDPFSNPEAALARRNDVIRRMQQTGFISAASARKAIATPIKLDPTRSQASCPASRDPYFCDYVKKWLMEQPALGATPVEREKRIYRGGLRIETTFDPVLNKKVSDALLAKAPAGNRSRVVAAAAVVEPGTGQIVALAQNTKYSTSQDTENGKTSVNFTVDSKYGGSGGFQIGSTAKIFGLVTALEKGYSAGSTIYAPPDHTRFSAGALGGRECGFTGSFAPGNAESNEHGTMSLQHATAKSINTAFVQLAAMVGVCNERKTMKTMGLHTANGNEYGASGPAAVILGADNASPLTVASSYATLASGGTYCEPVPVTKVTAFDGQSFKVSNGNCKQVISPKVAYDATKILQTVLGPEGTGRDLGLAGGRPAAGKTGTTDSSMQTWFTGFTPQRAAAVLVGTNPPHSLNGVYLGGKSYGHVYGATIAGPLWETTMDLASEGLPQQQFKLKRNDQGANQQAQVPDVSGRGRNSATRALQEAGFEVDVAGDRESSDAVPYNRVVRTSPAAGATAQKGDTVTLILSSGNGSRSSGDNGNGNGNGGGNGNNRSSGNDNRRSDNGGNRSGGTRTGGNGNQGDSGSTGNRRDQGNTRTPSGNQSTRSPSGNRGNGDQGTARTPSGNGTGGGRTGGGGNG